MYLENKNHLHLPLTSYIDERVYAKISDRKISRKVPKNLNQMG